MLTVVLDDDAAPKSERRFVRERKAVEQPQQARPILGLREGRSQRGRGGVFTPYVDLSEEVKEGQKLASIRNFGGEITEELVAPADGMIIAKWMLPMIGSGDFAAYELATFEEFGQSWPGER